MRHWASRLLGVAGPLLVSVLFLMAFEAVLRVAGFRVEVSGGGDPKANLLPLFQPAVASDGTPIMQRGKEPITFRRKKPGNGYRVFIVGESSVWGYPYGPELAFTRMLQDVLAAAWPERVVEVVNCGVPAIGSWHVRRIVAEEVAQYEPDVVVVYTGHNDWILPGPESVSAVATMAARLRVYQLAAVTGAAWRRWRYGPVDPARLNLETDPWAYARERARGRATLTQHERDWIETRYGENLRIMVASARAAGARVLLATLGQNLRDFPPGASRQRRGLAPDARAHWRTAWEESDRLAQEGDCRAALAQLDIARRIDRHPAQLHFARARCLDRLGRFANARAEYRRASDLDAVPLGAPSRLNARIRQVAAATDAELVDVAAALQRASPHGLVGSPLFCDHLHPSVAGHAVIARTLAATLGVHVGAATPNVDTLLAAHPEAPKQVALANIVLDLMLGWYDTAIQQIRDVRRTHPDFSFKEKDVEYLRANDTARPPTDLVEAAD